jgi:hypothetical protein
MKSSPSGLVGAGVHSLQRLALIPGDVLRARLNGKLSGDDAHSIGLLAAQGESVRDL